MKPTKRFSPTDFFETYIVGDSADQAKILLLLTAMNEEELAKFATRISSYVVKSKDIEETEHEKYSLVLHRFCEDLNDFYFNKLLRALIQACHSSNPVNPFVEHYLSKFSDDAKRVVMTLKA
jgi:hypothetical protein